MLPNAPDEREIVVPVADRWNQLTLVRLWMTLPGVDYQVRRDATLLAEPMTLANGRKVWLDTVSEQVTNWSPDPEPPATSALVVPMGPDTHAVSAPGYLVKGLRLG